MGLDMYLYRKSYVQNWEHMRPEELHKITIRKGGKLRRDIRPERIAYIVEQVAYWRKANAVHKWFVENCQDGNDDCGEYRVSQEKLASLVALCERVLDTVETVEGEIHNGTTFYADGRVEKNMQPGLLVAQSGIAAAALPTTSGFFFGSTDYDECYLDDLRETVGQLKPLIGDDESDDFYYHSSW